MATGETFGSDAGVRLLDQAAGNVQLLAMLEAMHELTFEDADHLLAAAAETQAMTQAATKVARMAALDPTGLSRERLQACIGPAGRMLKALSGRGPNADLKDNSSAQIALGLQCLVQACQMLYEAINRHDQPFDPFPVAA